MCSCGANKQTFKQIVGKVGTILPHLKFAYCAYKDQFENVFKQVGINVNEDLLPALAHAYDTGADLRGDIKNPKDGKPIVFSVEKQLSLIDVGKPVNSSCTI